MQRLIVEVVDRVYTAMENLTYPSFAKELRGLINKSKIAPKLITNDIFIDEDQYLINRISLAKEHQEKFHKKTQDSLK
ncbi:hypothetical protein [Aquimarina latercula]|uniref:hypothetical protein n=1 Tax=Aquimarina latercula TaxID=987 RepID=UPI0004823D01|nr:hypothetical protein [Aquimarina latercula]